jgi:phosphatidyl-myo-inositol dimannoside synthase
MRYEVVPVLLTFDFPPEYGGIQRYVVRLADSLLDLGKRVAVVAPRQPGSASYDRSLRVPVRRFAGYARPIRMLCAMFETAKAYRIVADGWTIASSWFPAGFIAALLPRVLRGRLMILAHGSEVAARPGSLRERLLRWTLARADRVVANSRLTAARVRDYGIRDRLEIVPCGVDERIISRAPADVPTVLFVGRLVPRKGVDRLIEALPAIRDRLGNVRLEIVGSGPDRPRLERLAVQLGAGAEVQFLGSVDDAELDTAYARAWCFAMPSRAEGDDVEGFGIVYLEAAIASLAAVGGRGSGAEDAIVDGVTGLIVDGADREAIVQALLQLLSDPARARAMGQAGRERALAHFTWKSNAMTIARALSEAA